MVIVPYYLLICCCAFLSNLWQVLNKAKNLCNKILFIISFGVLVTFKIPLSQGGSSFFYITGMWWPNTWFFGCWNPFPMRPNMNVHVIVHRGRLQDNNDKWRHLLLSDLSLVELWAQLTESIECFPSSVISRGDRQGAAESEPRSLPPVARGE